MAKTFAKPPTDIKSLAPNLGGWIATDRITVDGMPVRFMYRSDPLNRLDSGWHFTAGDETDEYMDDSGNHEIYDVNTIANYDPNIIPYLSAPSGSAFEWNDEHQEFVQVDDFEAP
jgi:hypothetical protein